MLTSAEPGAPALPTPGPTRPRRARRLLAVLATVAVLAPLAWLWWDSTMPSTYSVMDMGTPDLGGGPGDPHAGHDMAAMTPAVGVDRLRDTSTGPADVVVTLVARRQVFVLPTGERVDGYTLNGVSPGPQIRAVAGQTLQVRLVNADVADGVTLHWHGVDVPNGDDGVAGVTQDAVAPGGEFTYRFVARDAGTYWYHSHQVANPQVQGGLFGALVVSPPGPAAGTEVTALVHHYGSTRTVNGRSGDTVVPAAPGERVRVRVVNTDNGPMSAWTSTPFRLLAIDGTDVHAPTTVTGQAVAVTAGGRADLEVVVPPDGSAARVVLGGDSALLLGGGAAPPPSSRPATTLDPLTYGTPAPLGFDPSAADRRFDYAVGRRPGFVDGVPGMWWTVNGHMWPDTPMFVVSEGDVVRVRISNSSGEVHPMHLHGHHAVVLARDGVPATGSPWWFDSLDVADGATYDVAFVADNPGIWMDHCHNLTHAAQGLVAHLMYTGVSEPYRVGGPSGNVPE